MELNLTPNTTTVATIIATMLAVMTMIVFHEVTKEFAAYAWNNIKKRYKLLIAEFLIGSFILAVIIAINGSILTPNEHANILIPGPIVIAVLMLVTVVVEDQ